MNSDQEEPQGVAGWLAVLIAGMLVIGPMSNIASMAGESIMIETQFPALLESAKWLSATRAEWIAIFISSAISIYGGFGLLKKRTPDAVRTAKMVLWLNYPISVVVIGIFIPATAFSVAAVDKGVVFPFVISLFTASVWTIYPNRSKRVRNTYGAVNSALKTNEQTNTNELPVISNPAIASDLALSARTQEQLWADALTEFESASRRPGLWAKSFAEASGNDR